MADAERFQCSQQMLGSGAFSDVWRARDVESGRDCAIKLFRRDDAYIMHLEAECLQQVQHPNVLQMIAVVEPCTLVLELAATSLDQMLQHQRPSLSWMRSFMCQLLAGLECAHACGWVHCDIKPENLLLTDAGELKIADWGGARRIGSWDGQLVGTHRCWAPEVLLGEDKISPARDLWAVACVLFELLVGEPLFRGRREDAIFASVRSVLGCPDEVTGLEHLPRASVSLKEAMPPTRHPLKDLDATTQAFMMMLLTLDPKQRPTAKVAAEHAFLQLETE